MTWSGFPRKYILRHNLNAAVLLECSILMKMRMQYKWIEAWKKREHIGATAASQGVSYGAIKGKLFIYLDPASHSPKFQHMNH